MCLIVAKPIGTPMPSYKKLQLWWEGHPDGFGLAYLLNGGVVIEKGAMTPNQMVKLIRGVRKRFPDMTLRNVPMILHFRQATTGQVVPSNCHPFPLSTNEQELSATSLFTDSAVAHNGMIWKYSHSSTTYIKKADGTWESAAAPNESQKTDTQAFIEDMMADLKNSLNIPAVKRLVQAYTNSKFAVLTPKGINLIGDFIEDNGIFYSNGGYLPEEPLAAQSKDYYGYGTAWEEWRKKNSVVTEESDEGDGITGVCDFCHTPSNNLSYIETSLLCPDCQTTLTERDWPYQWYGD